MKTKVNKVPLVGSRGRRELLDRIEELEKRVIELEQSSSGNHAVSWEFNLIKNESYTTWESVNMTQEIYDAIINETIDLNNIKWYYSDGSAGNVAIPYRSIVHDSAGVINVRSGFSGSYCSKALIFEVNSDGTVRVEWD